MLAGIIYLSYSPDFGNETHTFMKSCIFEMIALVWNVKLCRSYKAAVVKNFRPVLSNLFHPAREG